MKLPGWKRFSVVVAMLLLAVSTAAADSLARMVRLSDVEGNNVEVDRNDGQGFNFAYLNEPVIEGMRIWTKDGSRAEIQFEDGSTMRLATDSVVTLTQLRMLDNGARSTEVDVQEGVVYFNLNHHGDDQFFVTFDQYSIDASHNVSFRVDGDSGELHLSVSKSDLDLSISDGQNVNVRKGETLSFDMSDPNRYYLAKSVAVLPDDDWNHDRDGVLQSYNSASSFHEYNDNYSSGYPEMSAYGSWVYDPFYGWIWRPSNAGFDW